MNQFSDQAEPGSNPGVSTKQIPAEFNPLEPKPPFPDVSRGFTEAACFPVLPLCGFSWVRIRIHFRTRES
jgi:hypothetical protein